MIPASIGYSFCAFDRAAIDDMLSPPEGWQRTGTGPWCGFGVPEGISKSMCKKEAKMGSLFNPPTWDLMPKV